MAWFIDLKGELTITYITALRGFNLLFQISEGFDSRLTVIYLLFSFFSYSSPRYHLHIHDNKNAEFYILERLSSSIFVSIQLMKPDTRV